MSDKSRVEGEAAPVPQAATPFLELDIPVTGQANPPYTLKDSAMEYYAANDMDTDFLFSDGTLDAERLCEFAARFHQHKLSVSQAEAPRPQVEAEVPIPTLPGVIDSKVIEFMEDLGIDKNLKIAAVFSKNHNQKERVFDVLIKFYRFMDGGR